MSRNYLPEYAESARLALAIAEKEAAHLGYSHRTRYAHAIDLHWVESHRFVEVTSPSFSIRLSSVRVVSDCSPNSASSWLRKKRSAHSTGRRRRVSAWMRNVRSRIVHDSLPEQVAKMFEEISGDQGDELLRLGEKLRRLANG